jgi:hypothetical protein
MPTMQQLPQAIIVDAEDEVLLAQDGETKVLTVNTLLAATQQRLTLAPGVLLGRASYFVGGPEPIAIGDGLVLDSGTLGADGYSVAFLDSPAFTGTPTAPTAPNGDSSDVIATTAFVQANLPRIAIQGDLVGAGSGTVTVTLPPVVAPGTYSAVTVNTKGLVISGTTLDATAIDTALGYTPYNAANPAGYTSPAGLDVFPALAYGAFFDGVHDDQPGIAAAIAAAEAAGGGTVLLPAGKGCLGSTLTQTSNSIHLVGAGVANLSHNTQPGYDTGTALHWIGAPGGTMAVIGPAQNLVNGRSISNADVRGIMFDCASSAAYGLVIASVNHSRFDVGYYQPLVCGLWMTTVFLQAQTSATAAPFENNDTQHNIARVIGYAVFYANTTLTAAAAGATTIPVGTTSNFVAGQQVRIGKGLYVLAAVGPTTLTLTTPLAASDGAAGAAVGCAPRGVWLHGRTNADLPAGYHPPGGTSFPQLWTGNVSLNQFESITLLHYSSGDALTFGNSDHNIVDKATAYTFPSGHGLVFDGSPGLGEQSGQNRVGYCSVGSVVARGTTTYPNTSGGALSDGYFCSQDSYIGCLDTANGNPYPTIEPGATMRVNTDTDVTFGPRLVTPIVYEAGWEPVTGTFLADPNTSLMVVNNSADHMRLCTGTGSYSWSVNIDGSNGNLRIYPTGASSAAGLALGGASSPAFVLGGLSVGGQATLLGGLTAGATSITGSLSIAGPMSAPSASISGAVVANSASLVTGLSVGGTASVTGALAAGAAAVVGLISAGTVSVTGALIANSASLATNLSIAGTASIAGALSAATGSIANALAVGSITSVGSVHVGGALTVPTPAASDNSTNAATTAWVAAKAYLPQLLTLAALRAAPFGALADGTTVLLDAYATRGDGGAGLFTWTAASTAGDNAGTTVNPTGNTGAGRWLRQLPDGRVTPQMFGALGDGTTNDTAAFAAALLAGPVIVPSATYRIANLAIPNGAWMEGGAGLGYSGDVATTPGTGQKPAVVAPILLAVAGTTSCILNVYGCNDATLKGLFLDGGSNTPTCDGVSSGSTQIMMERVTVVRCINGLGSVTNPDLYTHVATLINCEFANNGNGISNLIDTAMIGGALSANTIGVNLGSGANANSFIAVRFEWSINDGVAGYNASSNVFCGGLFDRNAWRGVNLGAGCKDWTFVGVQFARNGSNNAYPNNSHVALNGTTSVFFNGCVSRTGTNDDGSGTLSPAYFVNYINSNALVTISGCDVSGYITGFAFGSNPASYVQRDNFGAGDTSINAARPYISGGVVAQTLFTKAPATITPGASTSIALGQSPITTNYSTTTRSLHITAVNNNSPYQSCSARIALGFYRDTAIHTPNGSAAYGETGGTGIITWGGSGKIQLSASSVAPDGSTWTLGILNGGTADGSNWSVFAELH